MKKIDLKKIIKRIQFFWRKFVTISALILLVMGLKYCFEVNHAINVRQALTDNDILCNIYYITQIFTSLIVVSGGLVAVWQYSLTSRAERIKINTDCIQRAIDLAEYYKNNILEKYVVVQSVYDESGLMDIVKKINRNNMINFDNNELHNLLSESDIEEIKKIRESDKFLNAVIQADEIYNLGFNFERSARIEKNKETDQITVTIKKGIVTQKFMGNIVTEILNNLEFFAMHFSHETADESVVYQSLHQTYLKIVHVLYYNIAILNDMGDSKYYTNVIDLYRKWDAKDKQEKSDKSNAFHNCTSKGNTVPKI